MSWLDPFIDCNAVKQPPVKEQGQQQFYHYIELITTEKSSSLTCSIVQSGK
jgi:hypothetical protein